MKVLRAFLVEDEPLARKRLERLLKPHHGTVELIGYTDNAPSAVEHINQLQPDLLFLDIELPGMNGFEVLRSISHRLPVIFITAYAEHAIRAFEENALDYLLKPVDEKRLEEAIKRVQERVNPQLLLTTEQLEGLAKQLLPAADITSLPVKIGERFFFVFLDTITHFEARDKYVFVHTTEGKEYLTDHTLVSLEQKLPANFVRVHRGIIVNSFAIREIQLYFNNRYLLYIGEKVKITTGPSFSQAVRDMLTF